MLLNYQAEKKEFLLLRKICKGALFSRKCITCILRSYLDKKTQGMISAQEENNGNSSVLKEGQIFNIVRYITKI